MIYASCVQKMKRSEIRKENKGLNVRDLLVSNTELSLSGILLSLVIGFVLSIILKWHFEKFGSTFSNRKELGAIFPFIVLTITLVIAVVKSSLALSLGLVGALSIVRFRTPIKEPEELAYIFMAIAIGLGLGAERIVVTVASTAVILSAVALFMQFNQRKVARNLYLSVAFENNKDKVDTGQLSKFIQSHVDRCEVQRVDKEGKELNTIFYIDADESDDIFGLLNKLEKKYPTASISLIDQHKIPGL